MAFAASILIVSGDLELRRALANILNSLDLEPLCIPTVHESVAYLTRNSVAMVFCDGHLTDGTYRDLLAALRSARVKARVVIISRRAEWDDYLEAMRLGAFDVVTTPFRPTDVEWLIIQANREDRARERISSVDAPIVDRRAAAAAR